MIRLFIILLMFLVSLVTFSQPKYEQGMQQAFQLMQENKLDDAANLFERIGNAEKTNWLPYYNVALLKTRTTFAMKDNSKIEAQLKIAEDFIAKADAISPDNSEIYVLKALINVAKIASNPMVYGASLSAPTSKLYQKAIALDKNNPRAQSGLIDFEMGGAKFFNKDLTPYCKKLQKTLAMYDAFTPVSKFHPNWGKERVLEVLKECGLSTTTDAENMETIKVTVENVSGTDGTVIFSLFSNEKTFLSEAFMKQTGKISNGKATVTFKNVPAGEYAIVCYHDKNNNKQMDFNEGGMPLEDYGATNNVMSFGPPVYDDAKFTVKNKSLDLTIRF